MHCFKIMTVKSEFYGLTEYVKVKLYCYIGFFRSNLSYSVLSLTRQQRGSKRRIKVVHVFKKIKPVLKVSIGIILTNIFLYIRLLFMQISWKRSFVAL